MAVIKGADESEGPARAQLWPIMIHFSDIRAFVARNVSGEANCEDSPQRNNAFSGDA
jgi:hypothetical protein